MNAGTLYVVATPIGNLDDMTSRAVSVLQQVDLVLTEDTRRSSTLARHFGIETPLRAFHDHNEQQQCEAMVEQLQRGSDLALVSDAGTPLISDPGYRLVQQAAAAGITVVPVPGSCAAIAALSVAGLPTDRFFFLGFLSARSEQRKKQLREVERNSSTLVFYESPHRICACLDDLCDVLGTERPVVLLRELTKQYETVLRGSLADVRRAVLGDDNQQRGEIVLAVAGATEKDSEEAQQEADRVLQLLLSEVSVKVAARLAAALTGQKKNRLYERALELQSVGGYEQTN